MNTRTKSIAILVGTLLVGALLGSVVTGAVIHNRVEKQKQIRKPGGFQAHVRELMELRDNAQWEEIRPIVENAGRRHREIMDSAHVEMKRTFDSMLVELTPHLDPVQLERLKKGHEKMRKEKKRRREQEGAQHDSEASQGR